MGAPNSTSKCCHSGVDLLAFHTFITASPVIREKLDLVKKIADTNSSVLILGESGVGKELFAEQIHLRGSRVAKPFLRVNCAVLPDSMLESELFGHVKGAFTDAIKDRVGRFELANQGTIFLDEIGDMPLLLQAKLLRVLQSKSFEKLGSCDTIHTDVRIIAATNKNIEQLVEEGKFRSDLYFRLNVLPLYVPALRERKEDIIPLATFFMRKFSWETKKNFTGFSRAAEKFLMEYDWPGNVRELENAVERACVLGTSPVIQEKDFLMKNFQNQLSITGVSRRENSSDVIPLKDAVDNFKREYVKQVLGMNHNNQTATARSLNIQRTYLSRLMKELDIR